MDVTSVGKVKKLGRDLSVAPGAEVIVLVMFNLFIPAQCTYTGARRWWARLWACQAMRWLGPALRWFGDMTPSRFGPEAGIFTLDGDASNEAVSF